MTAVEGKPAVSEEGAAGIDHCWDSMTGSYSEENRRDNEAAALETVNCKAEPPSWCPRMPENAAANIRIYQG